MAENRADMQTQNHVSVAGGYWYRCSEVEFVGETAHWGLGRESRYGFFDAYRKAPHRQLVDADDDAKLCNFVKAWGPLRVTLDSWSGSDPIERYRLERDKLTATIQVLASVEDRDEQRAALTEWFEVQRREQVQMQVVTNSANYEGVLLFPYRQALQIPGDLQGGFDESLWGWLGSATTKQIESAVAALVPTLGASPLTSLRFVVHRTGTHNVLGTEIGLSSLSDALLWMVWQDAFQQRPWQFCEECRKLFQPEWKHKKKFCGDVCAHRKAVRADYRRKHPKRRKQKRGNNGAQKAG